MGAQSTISLCRRTSYDRRHLLKREFAALGDLTSPGPLEKTLLYMIRRFDLRNGRKTGRLAAVFRKGSIWDSPASALVVSALKFRLSLTNGHALRENRTVAQCQNRA